MTRNECISLSCDMKENPSKYNEFSGYLYSAVGMAKQHPDAGTIFAAHLLVDAIQTIAGDKLTPFCQRRIEIIEKMWIQKMGKQMEKLAKAIEIDDYNRSVREMYAPEDEEGYLDD